jgi:hypothetical protein
MGESKKTVTMKTTLNFKKKNLKMENEFVSYEVALAPKIRVLITLVSCILPV